MLHVKYFFRKRLSGFHSIEELFETVLSALNGVEYEICRAPRRTITPWNLLINIFWARRNQIRVNHITGDSNYLAMGTGRNTVLTIHDIGSLLKGNALSVWLKKQLFLVQPAKRVHTITVISQASADEVKAAIPQYAGKIRVVHNPYRKALLNFAKNTTDHAPVQYPTRIMLVGTKENKNLQRILPALQDLNVHLNILGRLDGQLKYLLEQLNLPYENRFQLSYEDVMKWYITSDVLCFASTYEGFGMPIIEAQALGIPVVTSNLGAMKEVAGDSACLVNPYEESDIRYGVTKVMSREDYRKQLIRAGRENIKRFDPQLIAAQYQNIYEEIAGNRF